VDRGELSPIAATKKMMNFHSTVEGSFAEIGQLIAGIKFVSFDIELS